MLWWEYAVFVAGLVCTVSACFVALCGDGDERRGSLAELACAQVVPGDAGQIALPFRSGQGRASTAAQVGGDLLGFG